MALLTSEVLEEPAAPPRLGYLATLDGLRAAAALAVVAYHVQSGPLRGGFLGVDVFFVLSGFLITRLLLEERGSTGRISLGRFWSRRARRLLPAMAAVVAFACAWSWTAQGAVARRQTGGDAVASLLYVANWHFIRESASYFAPLVEASPLRHLWSLAVEEQWYLVWPLVVVLVLRRFGARTLTVVCGVAALASVAWMYHLAQVADLDRAYYGTDTRAHSLLIGSMLAAASVAWPRLEERFRGCTGNRIGLVSLMVLGAAVAMAGAADPAMYRGGFLLVAVASAGLVAWLAFGLPSPVHRAFGSDPAVWLGKRSYGIYLWHWPVVVALTADVVGFGGPALGVLQAVASVGAAALSYWLLEEPVRVRLAPRPGLYATAGVMGAAALAAVALLASGVALPTQRPGDVLAIVPATATPSLGAGTTSVPPVPAGRPRAPEADPAAAPTTAASLATAGRPAGTAAPALAAAASSTVAPTSTPTTAPAPPPSLRVTLLGDSQAYLAATDTVERGLAPGVELSAWATIGCGLESVPTMKDGQELPYPGGACDTWPDGWRTTVERAQPDVVVILAGAWEVGDVLVDGTTLTVGTPEHDAWLRGRFDLALQSAGASGAPVAVLDLPCYQALAGDPTRLQSERNDPARVAHVNAVLADAVRAAGQTLLPYSSFVCDGGQERAGPDGQPLRYDGVHLTQAGVGALWGWLTPLLRQVVADHRAVGAS